MITANEIASETHDVITPPPPPLHLEQHLAQDQALTGTSVENLQSEEYNLLCSSGAENMRQSKTLDMRQPQCRPIRSLYHLGCSPHAVFSSPIRLNACLYTIL